MHPPPIEIFRERRLDLGGENVSDPVPQARLLIGRGSGGGQQEDD
jgi:hypothetical protein